MIAHSPVVLLTGLKHQEVLNVPHELTDPFLLVHEGRFRPSDMDGKDTRHPHRGFDNLWYAVRGATSTGHTTGPGGSTERVRLEEGSLLWLRAGRGVWHAEALGSDQADEGHGTSSSAPCCSGSAWPARTAIFDVELHDGGQVTVPVPRQLQAFAYLLDGEAAFGAILRRAGTPQLVLFGTGEELTVTGAGPGTRFLLMAGAPYREAPVFNGSFVDWPSAVALAERNVEGARDAGARQRAAWWATSNTLSVGSASTALNIRTPAGVSTDAR